MNLVVKPTKDSCILAAFAAAARVTCDYFIERIGHDGTKIVDGLPVGYHPQEIIDVLVRANVSVTYIEKNPSSLIKMWGQVYPIQFKQGNQKRFDDHVAKTRHGVLQCATLGMCGHAVAVDGYEGRVYDPDGIEYPYSELEGKGLETIGLWKLQTR
jgi:hypothetical protein